MADIFASALVKTLLGNLNSIALKEIGLAWGLEDELKSLESILTTVQLVLQDAEKKQRKSEVVQNWLMKLKNAAYDGENILDRITIEGFRRRRGTRHQLNSYFSRRNPLLFRLKIARKVRIVRERLDAIAEERIKFHLTEGVMDNTAGGTVQRRETSSQVNEQKIVGRNKEKEMIIETLLGTTRDDELSVYAIWGMGGLGKTTLAQLVYNDERTKVHFDLRIWVCVSDDFTIQRLLGAIIESIDQGNCNISALDPLQRYIQEKLRGKRFLLILDDVWNENDILWDGLKEALRCGSQGSVLMVTTRIKKVALMMATIPIHHLGYLSKADSWSLFRQRAFATGEGEASLTEIGKVIVEKCGGVPLAIKALGSAMRFKSSEREWLAIKESEIWLLPEDENGILPALRLSYDNLPVHMRQCFAYCCIFPKDCVMEEDQLVKLWMANRFLPSEDQSDLYLTGQLIFRELVWRSFFQEFNEKTCKMHDLMHDLAQSVMNHEAYIVEHGKALKIPKMLRHLDVTSYWNIPVETDKVKLPLIPANSLRSLIADAWLPFEEEDLSSFLSKQRYLRVLHLQRLGHRRVPPTKNLPNLISRLEHLRYLAMSCFAHQRLPESLTSLHYLQTLKLSESGNLLELPKGLKHMKNLWFLDIHGHGALLCMPPGVGELTCLQRLSIFIVGQDSATQIDQLKELNLGGQLSIRGLHNVRNFEDARAANLIRKKNLTSLNLSWMKGSKENSAEHFEEVLEGLQPHQNLEKLFITFYQGSRFPNWMSTLACKNLTNISLGNCHRCEHLPPLGKLPSLMHLQINQMDSIKHLDAEWHGNSEASFPALIDLTIGGMLNFEEWTIPDLGKSFPSLKRLNVTSCPKLIRLPSLPAVRTLTIRDSCVTLIRSIAFFTSLTSICLMDFAELDVLPEGLLQDHQALEYLRIAGLPNIRTLSNVLDNLSNLRSLSLERCPNLEYLPEGLKRLNFLVYLSLRECDSLTSFPAIILQDLCSLRTLIILSCKRLNPLSGPLQRESALDCFEIGFCPEFKYLPESMQQFTSLRVLKICGCEEIRSLPNWLGSLQSLSEIKIIRLTQLSSLPDGFQSLKSLKQFGIASCDPQLHKRCKKPDGEDWPKISHIPEVRINGKIIQYWDL